MEKYLFWSIATTLVWLLVGVSTVEYEDFNHFLDRLGPFMLGNIAISGPIMAYREIFK